MTDQAKRLAKPTLKRIMEAAGMTEAEAQFIHTLFVDVLVSQIMEGAEVNVPGLGTFKWRTRKSRGRNRQVYYVRLKFCKAFADRLKSKQRGASWQPKHFQQFPHGSLMKHKPKAPEI